MSLDSEARQAQNIKTSRSYRLRSGLKLPRPFTSLSLVVAVGLAFLALYPIIRVLWGLFVVHGSISAGVITSVFHESGVATLLLDTVILVLSGGAIAVVVGSILAWLVVRTDARMGFLSDAVPLLPFMLPALVGCIGWAVMLDPSAGFINVFLRSILGHLGLHMASGPFNIYSWYGMIAIYALYMTPFTFLMVRAGMQNMDSQLEEQARVSGASLMKTLRTVTIPAVRANIGAAMLLSVWFGFAFFSGPAILGTRAGIHVLALRVVNILSFSYPPQTGLAIGLSMFMLIAVGIAWYLQARLLRQQRFAVLGGKGRATIIELGPWKYLGRFVILIYVACSIILPGLALLWIAFRGYWSSKLTLKGISFHQFGALFQDHTVSNSIFNSFKLALIGATVGMIAAAIIARFVQTSRTKLGRGVDALVKISAPIPAIVLAVGFVLAFGGSPFNLLETFMILLLAYIAHLLPQATVSADAAAAQVGAELTEASHMSGAKDIRTFTRISVPLMLPGLVAGWGLLFLWMMGEVNASIILSGTGNSVMGPQIYNLYTTGFYGRVAAMSITLFLVNLIVISVVMFLSGRRMRFSSGKGMIIGGAN